MTLILFGAVLVVLLSLVLLGWLILSNNLTKHRDL